MMPGYVFVKVRKWLEIRRDKIAPNVINYYLFGWYVMSSAPKYFFIRLWRGWFFRFWITGIAEKPLIVDIHHHPAYDTRKRSNA